MEALGSAATITQLVSFTGDVLVAGYSFLSKVRKAPAEVRTLLKEIATLNDLLDQIYDLNEEESQPNSPPNSVDANSSGTSAAMQMLPRPPGTVLNVLSRLHVLEDCRKLVVIVKSMLEACRQREGEYAKNAAKRLLWPFKEKETKDLLGQLGRMRETLSAAVAIDSKKHIKVIEGLAKNIDGKLILTMENLTILQEDLKAVKANSIVANDAMAYIQAATESRVKHDEQIAIRKWLYPEGISTEGKLEESLKARHPNTGQWFMKLVNEWKEAGASAPPCIWFRGIAGCGKTVLAALAVERIRTDSPTPGTLVLCFFCDRRDAQKQTFEGLIYSILKQILDSSPGCFADLKGWYDERVEPSSASAKPLTLTEYQLLLKQLLNSWDQIILVVDALDEASDAEAFTHGLLQMARTSPHLRLILTSRHDVEMERAMKPLTSEIVSVQACMKEDIHTYLTSEVRDSVARGKLKFRQKGLDQKIVGELEKKSDGMILLAKLHLAYVRELRSDRAIKEALNTLPSTTHGIYDEILDQLCRKNPESVNELRVILQWLTYSMVPLTLDQLAEIVSIRPEDTNLDEEGIATDHMDLIALCGPLVSVYTEDTRNTRHEGEGGRKVKLTKLSHASVEEYFKSGMRSDLASTFTLDQESADLSLARLCLQYIAFKDFEEPCSVKNSLTTEGPGRWLSSDQKCLAHRTSKYPFAPYACRYWPDHLKRIKGLVFNERIINLLQWFLLWENSPGYYASWQQFYHLDIRYYCPRRPPLYYAIDFKMENLVEILLPLQTDVNLLVQGRSPLHIAARSGAMRITKMLILHGADVNLPSSEDTKSMTALHFAAEGGHEEIIKLLLEYNASVHTRNTSGSTPFYRAARAGTLDGLKMLYKAGSRLDAKTWDNWTPLHEALDQGRPLIAAQLLEWGADVNTKNDEEGSALTVLTRIFNENIIRQSPDWTELSIQEQQSRFITEANVAEAINRIKPLCPDKMRIAGYLQILTGLTRQHLIVQCMDQDTRPGTERQKDQRYFKDPSKIIAMEEFQGGYNKDEEAFLAAWHSRLEPPGRTLGFLKIQRTMKWLSYKDRRYPSG